MRRSWPEPTAAPGTHKPLEALSENLSARGSAQSANPTRIFVQSETRFMRLIRPQSGEYDKHLLSVIAAEEPVDGRLPNLTGFCGWTAEPFWFRPLMRIRRPVGQLRPSFWFSLGSRLGCIILYQRPIQFTRHMRRRTGRRWYFHRHQIRDQNLP
jgi:hypothetical protein